MSDNDTLLGTTRRNRLAADVGFLMAKGAGYAALAVFVIWAFVMIVSVIGEWLPEQSRDAPDPTPWSFLIVPGATVPTSPTAAA